MAKSTAKQILNDYRRFLIGDEIKENTIQVYLGIVTKFLSKYDNPIP